MDAFQKVATFAKRWGLRGSVSLLSRGYGLAAWLALWSFKRKDQALPGRRMNMSKAKQSGAGYDSGRGS